jgi:hypothetical protein
VFGPLGSGTVVRSESFHHQAKIVRKTFISTVFFLPYDLLSLMNDVNEPSKSNKPTKRRKEQDQEPDPEPLVRGLEPDPYQNVTDPEPLVRGPEPDTY